MIHRKSQASTCATAFGQISGFSVSTLKDSVSRATRDSFLATATIDPSHLKSVFKYWSIPSDAPSKETALPSMINRRTTGKPIVKYVILPVTLTPKATHK